MFVFNTRCVAGNQKLLSIRRGGERVFAVGACAARFFLVAPVPGRREMPLHFIPPQTAPLAIGILKLLRKTCGSGRSSSVGDCEKFRIFIQFAVVDRTSSAVEKMVIKERHRVTTKLWKTTQIDQLCAICTNACRETAQQLAEISGRLSLQTKVSDDRNRCSGPQCQYRNDPGQWPLTADSCAQQKIRRSE